MRTLGVNVVLGVDLAKWQGPNVPFHLFEKAQISFTISKATHGASSTPDPTFQRNFRESKICKGGRGAYTWYVPGVDPILQAHRFLEELAKGGGAQYGDVIGVDVEEPTTITGSRLIDPLEIMLREIRDNAKIIPHVYTGDWYWKEYALDALAESIGSIYPNWHAQYPSTRRVGEQYAAALAALPASFSIARPWRTRGARLKQFDGDKGLLLPDGIDDGKDTGIDADFNLFEGSLEDYRAYARSWWIGGPVTTETAPNADNGTPATSIADESNRLADERSTSRVPHLTDLEEK